MEFSLLHFEESLSNQLKTEKWMVSLDFYKTDVNVLKARGPFPHLSVRFLEVALLQWESLFSFQSE